MRLDPCHCSTIARSVFIAAALASWLAAAPLLATPTIGYVDRTCGQPHDILPNGGEFLSVKLNGTGFDDWQVELSAKGGPRLGTFAGDVIGNLFKTLGVSYRVPESPTDVVFILVSFPNGRIAVNSGDFLSRFNLLDATVLQVVGESSPLLADTAGVELPGTRSAYFADLGAGPESFPRLLPAGVEIAFAPLVDLRPREGCSAAGWAPEPGTGLGLIAGYNIYRWPDDGTDPTPEQIGDPANWVYFAPTRPDVLVPDDLSTLHDPNGAPSDGDEVVTYRDFATNSDGSPRAIGPAPEPGRRYWYAVQPVSMGDLDDWADLTLAYQEIDPALSREALRGDWRVDTDGDGLLDAVELPRMSPPDTGNGPEFLSPQAEVGLTGLGLTHAGRALLSPLISSQDSEDFEDCSNGSDDDGDGFLDCDDPDCDCLLGGRIDIGRDGAGALLVFWDGQLDAAPVGIHQGSLESLWRDQAFDHDALACDRTGRSAVLSMPAGNAYYLVTGGYGLDSLGRERPPSPNDCP